MIWGHRALLTENLQAISADLPSKRLTTLILGLKNFERLAHETENEGKDNLRGTSADYVYVHHDDRVLLEDLILLITEPE